MREKTFLHFVELGKYVERFDDECVLHIINENFYLSASVLELKTSLRSLLRFEVAYVDLFPYTIYL